MSNEEHVYEYIKSGVAKHWKQDYLEAISDYKQAILIDPNNELAHINCAKAFESLRSNSDAIYYYNIAININPNCEKSYYERGRIKLNSGDFNGALEDYTKIIDLNPNNESAYLMRAEVLLKTKDYKTAIEDYTKILELNHNNENVFLLRAEAMSIFFGLTVGLIEYTKAIELFKNNGKAYYQRGLLKIKFLNSRDGITDFLKVLEIKNDDYELRQAAGHEIYQYLISKLKSHNSKITIDSDNPLYKKFEQEIIDNIIVYKAFTKIEFGKYRGETLNAVLVKDPNYIIWCIINLRHFTIIPSILVSELFESEIDYLKAIEINFIKIKLRNDQFNENQDDADEDDRKNKQLEDFQRQTYFDGGGGQEWSDPGQFYGD